MRRPTVAPVLVLRLSLILAAAGCAPPHGAAGGAANAASAGPGAAGAFEARTSALAVDSALTTIAATPLWPGFAPLATPVAIFDGTRTYLFRHPSPPAGYAAVTGRTDVVVRDGRDSAVTANTSASVGGLSTATVMLGGPGGARDAAALTTHELFHVYQRARHPSWQANEADLFTYPVDDSIALSLRREETSALARAVAGNTADVVRCWARAFVDARQRRFAVVGKAPAAYERGTELNEGLAQYVERRAGGRPGTIDSTDVGAAEVRQRAYAVGAALGAVLDRVRSDWREALERAPDKATPPLDSLLATAVGPQAAPVCAASAGERARWGRRAADEVRALVGERARMRAEHLGRAGWRIVVEAGDVPFFPQGFDPLNVSRLSPTAILHTRFLKLQGGLGAIEVLGGTVLTEGAPGAHPLFNGVHRLTVTGLSAAPSMSDSAGVTVIEAPGVSARLRRVRVDVAGDTVRVTPR
jgi:hypothetical protein